MGQHMADDIKSKVSKLEEIETVDVDITFDPPWNPDMMTD
jgi:metal-sulfur cluster biosynthetic enzyme